MATQDSGIPFSYSRSQAPVRLLELPPALLALASADSPPVLKIRAAPTPATGAASSANHAVLCTPTQTFALREVRSSNSIFLVQPASPGPAECEDALPPPAGLTIVSTAHAYLELLPTAPDPCPLLEKRLMPYHGWEDTDGDSTMTADAAETGGKEGLREDVPASDAEFDKAWDELLGFELDGRLYRPTPRAILKTLSVVFTSAAAESLPLCSPFTLPRLMAAIDEPDVPRSLVAVLIRQVCGEINVESGSGQWALNISKCCAFVGRKILEDWRENGGGDGKKTNDLLYISFLTRWKEAVPEECKSHCKLDCLKGYYSHPTPSTIRCATGDATSGEAAKDASASPGNNKWHEKFKKSRK